MSVAHTHLPAWFIQVLEYTDLQRNESQHRVQNLTKLIIYNKVILNVIFFHYYSVFYLFFFILIN